MNSLEGSFVPHAVVIALLLAFAATGLRAPFVDFPLVAHPDEPIIGELALQAARSGRLSANWISVTGKSWSRPTYQFSPYTFAENGAALAAIRIWGVSDRLDDQVRFARWFSVAVGGLSVLVCYFAARAWFGDSRTALLAQLLLAVSFLHVQDSSYARVEATLSLAVLLAFWGAGSAMNSPTIGRCVVLGLSIGLAIATKYNAAPIVVLILAPLFARRSEVGGRANPIPARIVAVALAIPVGFFLATPEAFLDPEPLFKGIRWELAHYAKGHVPHHAIDDDDGNVKFWANYLARLGFGWAPTLAAAGFFLLALAHRGRFLLLALFITAAAVLLLVVKVRFERNAEILLGPACLAAATFMSLGWSAFPSTKVQAVLRIGVLLAVGGTLVQNGVALRRFRQQQQPSSSPFAQVPASMKSVRPGTSLSRYIHDPISDDWEKREVLVFAGHSDPFSQRALQRWQERLKGEWRVEVFRTPWLEYGYPFSTVESYHGPGFLMWARRKAPGEREAAYHQGVQPGRSDPLQPNPEITPEELHRRRTAGESILVVDVRNPNELEICRIAGSTNIPIGDLPTKLNELDPEDEIVVHCKMGGRSSQAAEFLRAQGYRNVRNLTGGILAWIDKVEPGLTRY